MKKYSFYSPEELKPQGWLKRQLEIQAESLSGNLDKIWRDVRDSAWIGGDAEGWERVPYWLDGFIPLAYVLDNEDMIERAKKYINAIIASQRPSGWICPCDEEKCSTYDTWAVQLISKVMTVYYECSKDERIPEVIYKTLKNYYTLLKNGTIKLYDWGKFRWFECFIAINFLRERYDEEWICDLAKILREQGTDYSSLTEKWIRPLNKWTYETHIVNLAMMLKSEAVSHEILGEEYTDKAEALREILYKYNGTPVELFTGDECLSGLSPIQGTELCSVVEQMYSYELLYAYTGDKKWAERLEVLSFNALPATFSDDMWTHQYVQISNQMECSKFPGKAIFRTNFSESHLFGLEPNFGCCTANMNQGFPKFALSAFLHNENEIVSSVPVPSVLKTETAEIDLQTSYPFENSFTYNIKVNKPFVFKIRIPSFAENVVLNRNDFSKDEDGNLCFSLEKGEYVISLSFETSAKLAGRPNGLKTLKKGSLVFSLPVKYEKVMYEYTRDNVERKFPYCDYEYVGKTPWNYAFAEENFETENLSVGEIPFSSENPPVVIKTKMKKILWEYEDGYENICAKTPVYPLVELSDAENVLLYPYGCAKLRMTEMPLSK